MRTVFIGSDFMYDSNGNLRPIEINTAVGYDAGKIESDNQIFDLTELNNFVISNNFKKVIYVGGILELHKNLENFYSGSSISYQVYMTDYRAITIPYVEDDDETLIIRSAYDISAIVDEEYCKDKIGFLNLVKNSTFGSEFAYRDVNGVMVSNITTIPDNGLHPNFILKYRYPAYDKKIYPKLYRVTSLEELNVILQEVTNEYFMMPYYFNDSKLYENHIKVFRGLNLLFPPNLNSIKIGGYTKITTLKVNYGSNVYDPSTFELTNNLRDKYITKTSNFSNPKLEDTDLVQLHDGTWKTALDLEVGDLLKTINFPIADNVDILDELANLQISCEQMESGSTYSSNFVTNKHRVDKINNIVKLTFTDDTEWEDVEFSSYLVCKDDIARFQRINTMDVGDKMYLVDTSNSNYISFVTKIIKDKTIVRRILSGWEITVERAHIFLTKSTEGDFTSYAAIEHNVSCGCPNSQLPAPCSKDCPPSSPCCINGNCGGCP